MSGSGASNLGYGNINPFDTQGNPGLVNASSSNYAGSFSSNEIPCKGGALKRRIRRITRRYKKSKRNASKMKRSIRRRFISRRRYNSLAGGRK